MGLKKTREIQSASPQQSESSLQLFVSPREFFAEKIQTVFQKRNLPYDLGVQTYLTGVLEHYVDARNLFEEPLDEQGNRKPTTLAEMFLIANQSEAGARIELLKKLGDKALYVSGFFSDSFQRKIIDVDYYADIGGAAYGSLANAVKEDALAKTYRTFSQRFLDFVEVLNYISHDSGLQNDQNILRLYDRYVRTGSEVAREKLAEMGVVTIPKPHTKLVRQD